jgi:hypothetical protein
MGLRGIRSLRAYLYLDFALHYRLGAPEPAQVPKELSPHPYRT